jgi:predicted homoserine dehydrogenase-like protein
MSTIAAGKHMVMMNVEADVTIGPYLSAKATEAGVVYTLGAGDEPSSTMELVNFVRGLGYPIVAAGKGKNNAFKVDATPDAYVDEATRRNMNPRMLVEFVDGSKTMVEMVALANATGLVPTYRVCTVHLLRSQRCIRRFARVRRAAFFHARGRGFHRRKGRRAGRIRRGRDAPSAAARANERFATG